MVPFRNTLRVAAVSVAIVVRVFRSPAAPWPVHCVRTWRRSRSIRRDAGKDPPPGLRRLEKWTGNRRLPVPRAATALMSMALIEYA
ncbi:unnamed protein product, partial [Iphiclides podalirius]